MVKTTTRGKNGLEILSVRQFVEDIVNQFSFTIFLKEEHINRTDELKKYRDYKNGIEVKDELASMLDNFIQKYEHNDYVISTKLVKSRSEGLSNYVEVKFNTPFGSKPWLAHLKIRISDHPKHNDRKIDEYIYLEGKSVEDIEKELDRIINKRIRRIEREFNVPMAQNESLRKENNNMKLRINENNETGVLTVSEFIDELNAIFTRQFPNSHIEIKYVNNIRDDNIWIEMFNYGNIYEGGEDIDLVLNASATIYLFNRYDNTSEMSYSRYAIVPAGFIYLPTTHGYTYEDIVGSGRTTKGDTNKILTKFTQFCKNCASTYKRYYK